MNVFPNELKTSDLMKKFFQMPLKFRYYTILHEKYWSLAERFDSLFTFFNKNEKVT